MHRLMRFPAWSAALCLLLAARPGEALADDETPATSAPAPASTAPAAPARDQKVIKLENFIVHEQAAGAQATYHDKAGTETLTEVVSGAALQKPTAQNGSDLLKDVSGVTVNKTSDGASKVSVRGLDQRLLRITVDGQRQGGMGNPLDNLPPELIASLEVTKSFTPDMEADAVGGVINVNTGGAVLKEPVAKGRDLVTTNPLDRRPGTRNSASVGRPFLWDDKGEPRASFLLTASFDESERIRERIGALREWTPQVSPGPTPYSGQTLPVLTQPIVESSPDHRRRLGLLLNLDARQGTTSLFWRSNFSHDSSRNEQRLDDTDPASGRVLALTPTAGTFSGVRLSRRDRVGESHRDAGNFTAGAKGERGRTEWDATVGLALTHEEQPVSDEASFQSDQTYRMSYDFARDAFAPDLAAVNEANAADTASRSDPAHYVLNYFSRSRWATRDAEGSLKLNAKIHLDGGDQATDYLKFGAKLQQRHRTADLERAVYGPGGTVRTMDGLVGADTVRLQTMGEAITPVPDAEAVAALLQSQPSALALDPVKSLVSSSSGDYAATETIWAAYGMAKVRRGDWTWLGGVRTEGTQVSSKANRMVLAPDGSIAGFVPARGHSDYLTMMPGLHLRYEPAPGRLWRASVTRSLSRPGYSDLVPFVTYSFPDHRSRAGNPGLKPYQATNIDLSWDRLTDRAGLISVALFFKKIDHFIADTQTPVTVGTLGQFTQFGRVNGQAATAAGVELTWQSPKWDLPATLGHASFGLNYSNTHGTAHYPTRPGETFPLPDQVTYQGGLTFQVERSRLSLEGAVRYRSKWWEDLIAPGLDNYQQGYWDAELSAACRLGKDARLTAGVGNLLNRPIRHYSGSLAHFNEYQRNGADLSLGVQWKL